MESRVGICFQVVQTLAMLSVIPVHRLSLFRFQCENLASHAGLEDARIYRCHVNLSGTMPFRPDIVAKMV